MTTLFSRSENELAKTFMDDVRNKRFIQKPTELNSNKSRRLYDSFVDLAISSKPKEYFQNDFTILTRNEIIELFVYTVLTIFGNTEKINKEMESFFERIQLSNDNEILSGINLTFRDEVTNKIECFVEVPSFNNTSSVVSLVHEFIHFHMSHKEIDLNKKYYYTEIFSILGEKIAANKVEELIKCQDMVRKIENTRLNGIVYAENLYKKYIEDQEKTTYDINKVLNGENKINSLLSNYNIGINQQSITVAKQKIKSITKK